jgi:ribosomal protein S18 acetylase RimI-like enzyme
MLAINRQEIDRYWAAELGTGPDFLPSGQPEVICTVQQTYSGVQFFQRDGFLIVASPPHLADFIASRVRGLPIREIFSVEFVERLSIPGVERILGPARVGYADSSNFRPSPTVSGRMLAPEDAPACHSFTAALAAADLEQSGLDSSDTPAFGAFAGGFLRAIASYQIWQPRIAHIMVATHPDYRRRGFGRAAVSALAEHAFAHNLIPQYRALASNENSLKLGHSLGFQHYCSTINARLKP